ncbi:hypothetical protein BpHYR1_048090 [Brachionus plicatilis]|uniref:Uncharacterized protein n=1 Tax=Brachionus plicatilis TaxID=10195 RepID=A0A3M7S9A3_BRAPC|nr:hypothetical protein BpHYR1_048090 [Brachionus plicatilis]
MLFSTCSITSKPSSLAFSAAPTLGISKMTQLDFKWQDKNIGSFSDVKLAIEIKQKQLQKQQQELEEKLRKLEEQQNELEKQTKKTNSNSSNQNQSLSETNNSLTLSHSINSNKSQKLTSENTEKSKVPTDEDEIKRIDYQKKLLELTSTKTLAKCAENDNQFDKLIEDRKKEIQKKFGLEVHSSSNSSLNTIKDQNAIKQKPVKTIIQSDDKHTIYSGDSGFVSSSNNYNMNLRNQQIAKRPINMAVEQLNKEVMNAAKNKNPVDLLNFLNGEMNEEEYRRRLSLITNQSDSTLTNEQLSKLFGLEFYDSNNLSDVRDSSIEKIIGWSILQAKMEKETKSKSSGLCSKTNMSSASSDDTLNDQSSNDFSDNDDKSDDGHLLIMSLLKCNKNKQNDEVNNLEFKKQIIQDQLEMVRRQKDQLDFQQSKNCKAFNTTSLPPPVKFNKFVNDHNLHELSTIKEVDTPISERNVKLTNSTRYQINKKINDHYAFLRCVALHYAHFSLISRTPSKLRTFFTADCVASKAIGASDAIFESFSNLS